MVFEDTFTASPETACTDARPFCVRSEVRKTRARGGGGGGPAPVLGPEEGWWGEGVEWAT